MFLQWYNQGNFLIIIGMALMSFVPLAVLRQIPKHWLPEDFWMTANTMNVFVFLPLSVIFLLFGAGMVFLEGRFDLLEIAIGFVIFFYFFQFAIEGSL